MKFATLAMATLSFACSAGTLYIMAKTANELVDVKQKVDTEIQGLKAKISNNARIAKAALGAMEL